MHEFSYVRTWNGPAWSPANTLASVVISIQSLLNENPYHNEPGFESERRAGASFLTRVIHSTVNYFLKGEAKRYNDVIRHETLRVAVCDALEGSPKMPDKLQSVQR